MAQVVWAARRLPQTTSFRRRPLEFFTPLKRRRLGLLPLGIKTLFSFFHPFPIFFSLSNRTLSNFSLKIFFFSLRRRRRPPLSSRISLLPGESLRLPLPASSSLISSLFHRRLNTYGSTPSLLSVGALLKSRVVQKFGQPGEGVLAPGSWWPEPLVRGGWGRDGVSTSMASTLKLSILSRHLDFKTLVDPIITTNFSLFIKHNTHNIIYLLVYVDDILLTSSDTNSLHDFIQTLNKEFSMKDLRFIHYFLGVKVHKFSQGLFSIKPNMLSIFLPMPKYLIVNQSLPHCRQNISSPPLNFLKITISIEALLIGQVVLPHDDLLLASAHFLVKQSTVARSSAEAEYRALTSTATELTWLFYLLCDLGLYMAYPTFLFCDNISTLYLIINLVFYARTKHIKIDYHFVQEKVALGPLETKFIPSKLQVADILTKALPQHTFEAFRGKLGLWSPSMSSLRGRVEHYHLPQTSNKSITN
ncbi:Reverse transcriptase [Theobroma cacao]|nr:Reverse transcriptase [Theobroma cacao]